ncbi:MAG TPA: DEAD/DEAH box helicase [Aquifex aeolicus]|nr:DEAD/DEAH box helicase [Aquifex aeolicus]
MFRVVSIPERERLLLIKRNRVVKVLTPYNVHEIKRFIKTLGELENPEELKKVLENWIQIEVQKGYVFIRYPYKEEFVRFIKSKGALWDKEVKRWKIPKELLDEELFKFLKEKVGRWNSESIKHLERVFEENRKLREISEKVSEEEIKIPLPEGLSLFPYQKVGVRFLLEKNGIALIGDEMGLGKTVMTIAYLNTQRKEDVFPAIVICPASVKAKWVKEFQKWSVHDLRIFQCNGKKPVIFDADVYVINYDILPNWVEFLKEKEPKTVVLDEAHYVKNPRAKRTKAVYKLKSVGNRIALTGTPIVNDIEELFTILHFLRPDIFRKKSYFLFKYQGREKVLQDFLRRTVMIRRLKKDVMKELPPKVRSFEYLEVDAEPLKRIEEEIVQRLKETEGWGFNLAQEVLNLFDKHREVAGKLKIPFVAERIHEVLSEGSKVVVFAHHKRVIGELEFLLKGRNFNVLKITGETPREERQRIIDYFHQKGEVLIASIGALSEGVDITCSSYVFFLQIDWTPAKNLQAEDRLHRIGQQNTVFSYWFVAKDTLDEHIVHKVFQKVKLIEKTLGMSEGPENFDKGRHWSELIKEISEELFFS